MRIELTELIQEAITEYGKTVNDIAMMKDYDTVTKYSKKYLNYDEEKARDNAYKFVTAHMKNGFYDIKKTNVFDPTDVQ